ncbi:cytidine deaminase [Pyxicephalus adspersus]|uniref:cytidine deaminase n=1 Tax=Pyxicephalus adspersus TaxID=30357 RepID=UPI003B5C22FE
MDARSSQSSSSQRDNFLSNHKSEKSGSSALDAAVIQNLLAKSHEAKTFAYCPYSKFRVGAALLGKNGKVYLGCNVENVSYTLGICAERNAIHKAVCDGCTEFMAIAITSDLEEEFTSPCGACRQVMREFGEEWEIFLAKPNGSILPTSLHQLLPMSFGPEMLKMRD